MAKKAEQKIDERQELVELNGKLRCTLARNEEYDESQTILDVIQSLTSGITTRFFSLQFILLLIFASASIALTGCTAADSQADKDSTMQIITNAKEMIESHEKYVLAADLEGIVSNAGEDVIVLTPGMPLVKGRKAFRELYVDLLKMGTWDMDHSYEGAKVVGDLVTLHGVATGTLTPEDGEATTFANNFVLVLRPGTDGHLEYWRIAFAPNSR